MGLFDAFKKKKEPFKGSTAEDLELPPPPSLEGLAPSAEVQVEEAPQLPEETVEMPEEPMLPEAAMPQEAPAEPHEMPALELTHPAFVSVQDYKDVLNSISYIRNRLAEADALNHKLMDIKHKEAKEFEAYLHQLEDVQRKLTFVEDVIASAG